MIAPALLALAVLAPVAVVTGAAVTGAAAPAPSVTSFRAAAADELDDRIAALGEDVDGLVALAGELKAAGKRDEMRRVFARVIEIDPDHAEARKGLGHYSYDGKWFESYLDMSAYKREEAKRMLEEHGLVRHEDQWVPQADLPFIRMSWVKDEAGEWIHPFELERKQQAEKYRAEGWQQQDLTWIPPDEFPRWEAGLFKCGDEWLSLEDANAWHAELPRFWQIPGEHFIVLSTLDNESARWAYWYADQTWPDLVRIFGLQPKEKPAFVCLRSQDQYNLFAAGAQDRGFPPTESNGFSSLHYAYYADVWFDRSLQPPLYLGTGVSFWARQDEALAPYGVHSIRHAAGQAYAEAIDPSLEAISRLMATPDAQFQADAFWAEKRIPLWLRYGAASYVERWFSDPHAQEGANWWARDWALANLRQKGGVRPLEQVFAMRLDLNQLESSTNLIHESGAVVSFMIDGDCGPVKQAHQRFKDALSGNGDLAEAVEGLQQALIDNREQLDAWIAG